MANTTLSKLAELISGKVHGPEDISISSHCCSSNQKAKNSLFVAIKGVSVDGHQFLNDAFNNGAAAAVVSNEAALNGNPGIVVSDTRSAYSALSDYFSGSPSKELLTIGVTGTNGKTTINWMVSHLLSNLGMKTSRLGTLGYQIGEQVGDFGLTTPDAAQVQTFFKDSLEMGMQAAVLEASSHGLQQCRVDHVAFDVGIFSNLTRDHLDYHADDAEYKEAKWKLFDLILKNHDRKFPKIALVNLDDPVGREYASRLKDKEITLVTYGVDPKANLRITEFEQDFAGSNITFEFRGAQYQVVSPYIGLHNALNLASAFGAMLSIGYDADLIIDAIKELPVVPGRLESVRISNNQEFGVFVDYAHTPDALVNVIKALRPLVTNRLLVLFGCGGDRDKGKRAQMAKAALKGDLLFVTSDNPRTEDPQTIIDDIIDGIPVLDRERSFVHVDRALSISEAIDALESGDVLLVAGKGHEDYQILGTEKIHFSDVEHVLAALEKKR